jgi:hypothetical protein
MKFMRKVGNGEIMIEDGQVTGAEALEGEEQARSWVKEFGENQDQVPATSWAAEFAPPARSEYLHFIPTSSVWRQLHTSIDHKTHFFTVDLYA